MCIAFLIDELNVHIDLKKISNDFKVYIYQSFWDKIWNVITYHGTYNFGDKKKEKKNPHQIYDQTKLTTISRH